MKTPILFSLLAFASATLAGVDDSSRQTIRARLSGYNEVPAISSAASGEFLARLDGDVLVYVLRYRDLRGATTTGAHIHFGQPGVNGGVIAHLCGGEHAPPCTPVQGEISGVISKADIVGPGGQGIAPGEFEEVLAAIAAGATYVNVHSDVHPGGEIRGQDRTRHGGSRSGRNR